MILEKFTIIKMKNKQVFKYALLIWQCNFICKDLKDSKDSLNRVII